MAKPIEPTETLTGKDAKRFIEAMENPKFDPIASALVKKALSLPNSCFESDSKI